MDFYQNISTAICPLLDRMLALPGELRLMIYGLLHTAEEPIISRCKKTNGMQDLDILPIPSHLLVASLAGSQFAAEAATVFYGTDTFQIDLKNRSWSNSCKR